MGTRILLTSQIQVRNPLSMVRAGDLVTLLDNRNPPAPGDLKFNSIEIDALEPKEVSDMLQEEHGLKNAHRSLAQSGEWSIDPLEEQAVWDDNGVWRKYKESVPHFIRFDFTEQDISNLQRTNLSKKSKLEILRNCSSKCFGRHPANMEPFIGLR